MVQCCKLLVGLQSRLQFYPLSYVVHIARTRKGLVFYKNIIESLCTVVKESIQERLIFQCNISIFFFLYHEVCAIRSICSKYLKFLCDFIMYRSGLHNLELNTFQLLIPAPVSNFKNECSFKFSLLKQAKLGRRP